MPAKEAVQSVHGDGLAEPGLRRHGAEAAVDPADPSTSFVRRASPACPH